VSSIQNAMAAMGYVAGLPAAGRCPDCAHADARPSGLRCMKGAFYVVRSGSCRQFHANLTPTAAPAGDDDMALPAGKSCVDCVGFERRLAFIGAAHINDRATRCDWAPSHFVERARKQVGPIDI
jgi:hypothetical protein